jgi:serine/threonine-protein kinase
MPLSTGDTFAGYRIVRLLGSGGMAEVYLAEHPRLPRRDALKVLPAEVSADGDFRERFLREADLASTLFHPHIVGVHDRGEFDGQMWISMDYIDGLDVARLLTQRYPVGMPADQVAAILTAVASALDYAHANGLLHRDVKPANIMITHIDDEAAEQRVVLTDFGIARERDEANGLTTTNTTVGTVGYSAPEQLMGEELDGRTDQYALAATAYHLLTGRPLFPYSNPAVVISRHLTTEPPRLAAERGELAALDPVMAVALAKRPEQRFPRCSDFARAFAEHCGNAGAAYSYAPTAAAPIDRSATCSWPGLPPPAAAMAQTPPALPVQRGLSRRRRGIVLTGLAVGLIAVCVVAAVTLWVSGRRAKPSSSGTSVAAPAPSSTWQPPPLVQAPPLDGTYRVDFGMQYSVNGKQDHRSKRIDAEWWGFRSGCSTTGCVATRAELDPHNPSAPEPSASIVVFHWTSEQTWQGNLTEPIKCSGPGGDSHENYSSTWSLQPGTDGTFSGTLTSLTLSDECDALGDVWEDSFTLTRTGPAPSGVVPQPPMDSATTAPGLPRPPITNPPASAKVMFNGQQLNTTGRPGCSWDGGKLLILIAEPGEKFVSADISAAGQVDRVDVDIGDKMFSYSTGVSNGATASVTKTGKKSYVLTGLVADFTSDYVWVTAPFRIDITCD